MTTARISYLIDEEQYYVFRPDGGEEFVGPETFGGWTGRVVDTGRELGRYRSLAEALAAHPGAFITKSARMARAAGNP